MDKKNIKFILAYDGTAYHGWQRQKNGITIQEIIEDKLKLILSEPVVLKGSGRTDTGVHALHQVCNFTTTSNIPLEALRRALSSLPYDISILKAEYVPDDFHSRYDVKSKIYEYRVWNKKEKNLFLRHYTWHIPYPLDTEMMKRCLSMLIGRHDFSSFKSTNSDNRNPVREMIRAELFTDGDAHLTFVFEADGFLRHMVRNIVGTIIDAGRGKISLDEFRDLFSSLDRTKAGIKAPPQGLFLVMVKY